MVRSAHFFVLTTFILTIFSCSENSQEAKKGGQIPDSLIQKRLDSLREVSVPLMSKGLLDYVDFYKKVLEIDPTILSAKINHAYSIAYFEKDVEGGIKEIRALLREYPDNPEVLFALGTIIYTQNPDTAFYYCEKSIALDPTNARNIYLLATCYDEQERYKNALETVEKAIRLRPKDRSLIFSRGAYRNRLGDHLGALEDMRITPTNYSDNSAVYLNRALCFYALKQYSNCIKDCDTALAFNPKNSELYFIRGTAKSYVRDMEGAFDDLKKAVELGNTEAVESYKLAVEYFKKNRRS